MNNFDLKDRVAVVTGGAQGFGFAITERFIKSGAKVIIWDIDKKAADEAMEKLNTNDCSYKIIDVQNFEEVNQNLIEIEKKLGKIDIFINNAGIAGKNANVDEYPIDEWNRVE